MTMYSRPFICRFPGCTASYHRKEHRRRHEAQNDRAQSIMCALCEQTFGRRDTLQRHMQNKHGLKTPTCRKFACTTCRNRKARCEKGPPCTNCCRLGIQCSLSQSIEESDLITSPTELLSPRSHNSSTQSKRHRSEKERNYIALYFKIFHPYWPFLHQASFREDNEAPLLVQSVITIGLWLSKEDNAHSRAIALHDILSSAILEQKERWDASCSGDACIARSWPIPTYQAILLHIIFAILFKDNGALGLDLKPCLSPANANLLERLVQSCKKLGMLYYPNMRTRYCKGGLPAFAWVNIEEVKWFNIALYRVCKACSQQERWTDTMNLPKAPSTGLRANDLQFPLPSSLSLWKASNKAEGMPASAEDFYRSSLEDDLEREWISKSAKCFGAKRGGME